MVAYGQIRADTITWLLEEENPGVRYLALRDLMDASADDPDYQQTQKAAHQEGPIAVILNEMNAQGFWEKKGPGYGPKYRSTVWSVIMLAQLGAEPEMDDRIPKACQYLLDHALTEHGQLSTSGTPGGTVECLQGNLCSALLDLGCVDPRLDAALEWMARSVTGEGVAAMGDKSTPIRYYSGNCGPGFECGANNKLPCAWGAVKEMLAFSKLPKERRTPLIEDAIQTGVNFLLEIDPATAAYPTWNGRKPSGNWWKFGFPIFYITDILQLGEALVRLGLGPDPRLANTLDIINQKQDADGRWPLEFSYTGKTWVDFGEKKQPNKWVTYRAAWVLKHA